MVFQRLNRPFGITRKADTDKNISLADAQHLLKHLTGTGSVDKSYIFKQMVKIKAEKSSQGGGTADSRI